MHMSDALITPIVGGTMLASSGGMVGYSIKTIKVEIFEKRLPLMAIMGAFLFAAQMINFAIPGTGSSGHIGGGMLLAIILGPSASFLTMACVLFIQALFFADGGLLAFGCNLINLGFFTAFVAYPFIFKPITSKHLNNKTIMIGSIIAAVVGLQLGSFAVVMETLLSGRTELTFGTFLIFMQPIHLAIGLVEGIITGIVVNYIYNQNPKMMFTLSESHSEDLLHKQQKTFKQVIIRLALMTIVIGTFVSIFASSSPDGLEWAILQTANAEEVSHDSAIVHWFEDFQTSIAVMPDYEFKNKSSTTTGTSVSGIVGSLLTLCVALLIGFMIRKRRVKKYE